MQQQSVCEIEDTTAVIQVSEAVMPYKQVHKFKNTNYAV